MPYFGNKTRVFTDTGADGPQVGAGDGGGSLGAQNPTAAYGASPVRSTGL